MTQQSSASLQLARRSMPLACSSGMKFAMIVSLSFIPRVNWQGDKQARISWVSIHNRSSSYSGNMCEYLSNSLNHVRSLRLQHNMDNRLDRDPYNTKHKHTVWWLLFAPSYLELLLQVFALLHGRLVLAQQSLELPGLGLHLLLQGREVLLKLHHINTCMYIYSVSKYHQQSYR